MKHSLEVYHQRELVYYSDEHWLYPLMALENFLTHFPHPPAELVVQDKIVGKAAALILVYLKIGTVEAGILSRLGKEILEKFNIPFSYHSLVNQIYCQTEELLQKEDNPARGYQLIKERINRIPS